MIEGSAHPLHLVRGELGSSPSATAPELPRPLYVDSFMVDLIEGWAANAATHGVTEAWQVLMATSLWRANG